MKTLEETLGELESHPLLSKLRQLGLNVDAIYYLASGMSTIVFDTGYEQVVKYYNPEVEDMCFRPPSKYVLQPVCLTSAQGYKELALFPKLDVENVTASHQHALKAKLAEEGYCFSDDKLANIGLAPDGTPYVIDSDAISLLSANQALASNETNTTVDTHTFSWPESQWSLFDCEIKGMVPYAPLDSQYWTFDEQFDQNIFAPASTIAIGTSS